MEKYESNAELEELISELVEKKNLLKEARTVRLLKTRAKNNDYTKYTTMTSEEKELGAKINRYRAALSYRKKAEKNVNRD